MLSDEGFEGSALGDEGSNMGDGQRGKGKGTPQSVENPKVECSYRRGVHFPVVGIEHQIVRCL